MVRRTLLIAPIVILVSALPAGCRDSQARSAGSQPSSATTSSARPLASSSASHHHVVAISRHAVPTADHSLYHNPDYAVGFRYPKNFILSEDDPGEGSALVTQARLDAKQPGAILLASVIVPDDAFPNTSIAEGHLQLVVNPALDQESCRELVLPENASNPDASDQLLLRGITLYWRDRSSVAPGTVTASRDYAGFVSGVCYEFFLEATSSSEADLSRHAISRDLVRVLRPLEKSVSSLDLRPASEVPTP